MKWTKENNITMHIPKLEGETPKEYLKRIEEGIDIKGTAQRCFITIMTSLAEQTNILNDAGFSQKEIEDWKKDKVIKVKFCWI